MEWFATMSSVSEGVQDLGWLSVIPPLLTIVLAIVTKKIVPSLILGIFVGSTILCNWNPILGFFCLFQKYLIPSLGSPENATILLYAAAFGGLLAVLQKNGGDKAFSILFHKHASTQKKAELYTLLFGLFIFLDDYFNCLTLGTAMRPICDRVRVARAKLAFIIDTTAAPVCLIAPVSTWVVYVVGLLEHELNGTEQSTLYLYFKTIPLNLYSIVAIIGTFFLLTWRWSFGPMKISEEKALAAEEKQQQNNENDPHAYLSSFILPIMILIILVPIMLLYTGGYWNGEGKTFLKAICDSHGAFSILVCVVIAGIVALFLGMIHKYFTFFEGIDHYTNGIKEMSMTFIILILAWSIGIVIKELKTVVFLQHIIQHFGIPTFAIPALLFAIAGGIAFTTGTSYGTFAIIIPFAVSLATKFDIPLTYAVAAALSGGVFGDHASPISDTTILSTSGADCDHMEHVETQLPYALIFAFCAFLGYLILGLFNSNLLAVIVTLIPFFIIAYMFHRHAHKHDHDKVAKCVK